MLLSLPIVISPPFLVMFTGTVGFTSSMRIWICSSSLPGSRSSSSILSRLTNSPCNWAMIQKVPQFVFLLVTCSSLTRTSAVDPSQGSVRNSSAATVYGNSSGMPCIFCCRNFSMMVHFRRPPHPRTGPSPILDVQHASHPQWGRQPRNWN